jgi:hypothetical protein
VPQSTDLSAVFPGPGLGTSIFATPGPIVEAASSNANLACAYSPNATTAFKGQVSCSLTVSGTTQAEADADFNAAVGALESAPLSFYTFRTP